jgi:hypothetical protein
MNYYMILKKITETRHGLMHREGGKNLIFRILRKNTKK